MSGASAVLIEQLSDEDLAAMQSPPAMVEAPVVADEPAIVVDDVVAPVEEEVVLPGSDAVAEEPKPAAVMTDEEIAAAKTAEKPAEAVVPPVADDVVVPPVAADDAPKPAAGEEGKAPVVAEGEGVALVIPDDPEVLKGFYQQIMTPFKANGKMIELKDPKEAIQLMQMGANYTKKLQDIQPHRKVLMMLQNNDLLDEAKLSFLIDLEKKDPEAIKKLVKDSGIDPMDIDITTDTAYFAGSHTVTDEEANFTTALEEITSSPAGKETLLQINSTWDEASKSALWKSPEIMSVIHEQRESGVYDVIIAEMDRQKMLGTIPVTTPFLAAYKTVGDELVAAGKFTPPEKKDEVLPPPAKVEPEVIETRAAAPKSPVANGDLASAAASNRSSARKAEGIVDPLTLGDEDFLKHMASRL